MAETYGSYLNELLDIDPDRYDLVKSPAIGRKFLLIKSSDVVDSAWDNTKADYTIEQLANAVTKPILAWARSVAKSEEREIVKEDLKLRYREPNGTININGIRAALRRLPQTEGVPEDVLAKTKEELQNMLDYANGKLGKSSQEEEFFMNLVDQINEFLKGLGKPLGEDTITEFNDLFGKLSEAVEKGVIPEDEAKTLLDSAKSITEDDGDISKSDITDIITRLTQIVEKSEENQSDKDSDLGPEDMPNEDDEADSEKDESSDKDSDEGQEDEVAKSVEAIRKQYEDRLAQAEAVAKSAREEVERLKIEKQHKDWVEKSKTEFSHLAKTAEEFADLFMKLDAAGVDRETIDGLANLLKATDEMIEKGALFNEIGSDLDDEGTAKGKLEKQARDLVESGDFSTMEQAKASIIKSNPGILRKLREE